MGWGVLRSSNNKRLNVRGSGGSNRYRDVVNSWSAGNWHHVSVVIEGTVVKFYADGVYKNNRTNLNLVKPSTNALKIGRSLVNNDKWGGSIDEVRISTVARSLDWLKAAYDNQKASQSLVNYGTVIGPRVITSPLLQDATVGTSFTYNTTTVGSPSSYTFLNLPGGLQFNPTTGVITGNPTTSGQFPVVVVVGYADDDGNVTDTDSSPDQIGSLFPPQNPGDADQVILNINVQATAPTVTTTAASSIEATKASFNGNVTSTGGDAPTIRIYYGTSDGASTPSSWSFVEEIGSKDQGAFGAIIGDLIPQTAYHYRIRAYNSAASAGVWASSSQTFTTQATTLPVVSNGSILNATGTAVTFKAGITALGIGKVDQGAATFTANRYPNLMLWFDANDVSSMDKGLSMSDPAQPPSNNNNIGFWADKSGNEHHGSPYQGTNNRKPKYLSAGMNSKPTVQFDGGDSLFLNNSA
ncbi:MAG: LamG-like jellyroll fold domain-containing protein, partial [Verrucomicrobiota bacterium]|nr:LamG-like jellyroll fold domain-containing protein [Verrucomicrobiota bacterium]